MSLKLKKILLLVGGGIILIWAFSKYILKKDLLSPKTYITHEVIAKESVSQILQYFSAEYYGEVIHSSKGLSVEQYDELTALKNFSRLVRDALMEIENSKSYNASGENKKNKRRKILEKEYSELTTNHYYNLLLDYIPNTSKKNSLEFLRVKSLYEIDDQINSSYNANHRRLQKKNKTKELVYIARGVVTAGYDFSNLSENQIEVDEELGVVKIHKLKPIIFDTVINPWYSPKLKIKGFELLKSPRGKVDYKLINETKRQCKLKLLNKALAADILLNAKLSAQYTLPSFFSAVLGLKVNKVEFTTSYLELYQEAILYDKILGLSEINTLSKISDTIKNKEILKNLLDSISPGLNPNIVLEKENITDVDKALYNLKSRLDDY